MADGAITDYSWVGALVVIALFLTAIIVACLDRHGHKPPSDEMFPDIWSDTLACQRCREAFHRHMSECPNCREPNHEAK